MPEPCWDDPAVVWQYSVGGAETHLDGKINLPFGAPILFVGSTYSVRFPGSFELGGHWVEVPAVPWKRRRAAERSSVCKRSSLRRLAEFGPPSVIRDKV